MGDRRWGTVGGGQVGDRIYNRDRRWKRGGGEKTLTSRETSSGSELCTLAAKLGSNKSCQI